MLDHCKTKLITIIIKFSTILSIAWLKNTIIVVTIRTVRTLWIKVIPRTVIIEVITAVKWIMTTLGIVTAIRVIRPIGV